MPVLRVTRCLRAFSLHVFVRGKNISKCSVPFAAICDALSLDFSYAHVRTTQYVRVCMCVLVSK